jgi:hypothetical protein
MASAEGLGSLRNPDFLGNQQVLFAGMTFAVVTLAAMIAVSIFKPWGPPRGK